jgi:hypothetical protein
MPNPFVFRIKKGDAVPSIQAQLVSSTTKQPIDLSTLVSQKFVMERVNDDSTITTLVDAAATVTDAVNGKLEYQWVSGDTSAVGSHRAQFVLEWPAGTETIPSQGYVEVRIEALP